MAKFLFVLSSGLASSSSPTRCVQFAQIAVEKGHEVSLFLIDDGVVFAKEGMVENVLAPSGEEFAPALEALIRAKVPIHVCTPCAKLRGLTEDVLVEGAQLATGATLIDLAAEAKVFNF